MRIPMFCLLVLIGLNAFAFPLLYDVSYCETGEDSVACRFHLRDVPKGASVALYGYPSNDIIHTHPVNAGSIVDSFTVRVPLFQEENVRIFILAEDRMYGEMVFIPDGRYSVVGGGSTIEQYSLRAFYIGKYEICNEQYRMFIAADGYDDGDLWRIEGDLMKDPNIGWHYQGLKRMSKPWEWDFNAKPWFKNATWNKPLDPVCGMTWFECYAFSQWFGADMPTWDQLMACFQDELDRENPVESTLKVRGVNGSAAEWSLSGIDPSGISCGGCNEMRILENNEMTEVPYPMSYFKCPLFRNERLGFRIAIPATD